MKKNRRSFTMVELVFVIVMLGLTGVAGTQAVRSIFHNYLIQRSFERVELETHRILDFITRHLEYAVWESIQVSTKSMYEQPHRVTWVSKDMENYYGSFDGTSNTPRFSGVIKLEESHASPSTPGNIEIATLGSRLDLPRNDGSSAPKRLLLPAAHNATSYRDHLQVIETTAGQNNLTTKPQYPSPAYSAKELPELVYMVERELYSFVIDNLQLTLRKSSSSPSSEISYPVTGEYEIERLDFWVEGEGSVVRVRLCISDNHLRNLLDCGNKTAGFCDMGFCKESVVIQ